VCVCGSSAFVLDFRGNFEEVLELADEFVKYASPGDEVVKELDEFQVPLASPRVTTSVRGIDTRVAV